MGSVPPLLTFVRMVVSAFLAVEVWTGRGLVTCYLLFVISLADRIVQVLGVTAKPDESWILQMGRNLIDSECDALCGKRYLTIDRDTKYTGQFRRLVRESGTEVIRLPPMSPNLNAYVSHCTSFARSETTLGSERLSESFVPCALRGELAPGGSNRHSFLSL